VIDDKYWMPDVTWDRWAGACVDFGPDHTEGRLSPSGSIRCHDPLWAENAGDEWRWSYAGEAQGQWTPDLMQLETTVESGFLKIEG
jgi:hypothetical protein